MKRAQLAILKNIENVLDSNGKAADYRSTVQKSITSVERVALKNVEEHEKLDVELRDARLKIKAMKDW